MDHQERIFKAIEKALSDPDHIPVFDKDEDVLVLKKTLPSKEFKGKILNKNAGSYDVMYNGKLKKFSRKTLLSIGDKKGFELELSKITEE